MERNRANGKGIQAAEWFYSQSFSCGTSKPVGNKMIEAPASMSEQWNAAERRWYRVSQWADGRVTKERV